MTLLSVLSQCCTPTAVYVYCKLVLDISPHDIFYLSDLAAVLCSATSQGQPVAELLQAVLRELDIFIAIDRIQGLVLQDPYSRVVHTKGIISCLLLGNGRKQASHILCLTLLLVIMHLPLHSRLGSKGTLLEA